MRSTASHSGKDHACPMIKMSILKRILKNTGADKIVIEFLLLFLGCSIIIWLREPGITSLRQALWYCYAVVTTVGFGDIVVQHFISRLLSVLLSINAVLVIAIVTSVVVNYYTEILSAKRRDTLASLIDSLERLPELSREELEDISKHVKRYMND